VGRAKELTVPAGYTIPGIFNYSLLILAIHSKHVLGADSETDAAPGTAFFI
jgi:hypothetical protein